MKEALVIETGCSAVQCTCAVVLVRSCHLDLQARSEVQSMRGAGRCCSYSLELQVSSVRPLFAFLIYLWTLPHLTCVEERQLPPSLNTFPHINKPFRCWNARSSAFCLQLGLSPLDRIIVWDLLSKSSCLSKYSLQNQTHVLGRQNACSPGARARQCFRGLIRCNNGWQTTCWSTEPRAFRNSQTRVGLINRAVSFDVRLFSKSLKCLVWCI